MQPWTSERRKKCEAMCKLYRKSDEIQKELQMLVFGRGEDVMDVEQELLKRLEAEHAAAKEELENVLPYLGYVKRICEVYEKVGEASEKLYNLRKQLGVDEGDEDE